MSLKGAIAVAQEHTGAVGAKIRGDDIEFTISVHITQGHREWCSFRSEGLLGRGRVADVASGVRCGGVEGVGAAVGQAGGAVGPGSRGGVCGSGAEEGGTVVDGNGASGFCGAR
ncbi:hypothetical protein [Synechococcus sp. UW140]|uniref:hypothetical protein n=1 Tax=Synechococcus sp. UW140 TaxID=368503 RepID=UPI003137B49C